MTNLSSRKYNGRKEGNPEEEDQNCWKNVEGALIQSVFTLEVLFAHLFLKKQQ